MNAPNDTGAETRMGRKRRVRALLLGALLVIAAVAGIWAATRGGGNGPPATPAEAHAQGSDAGQPDPHAGMKMDDDGVVHLTPAMAASLGVTTVPAELDALRKVIRTNGSVLYDERRLTTVTPKFAGFVERLHVDFTGHAVRRGAPLLDIYSPELVAAQEELLAAIRMETQLRNTAAPAVVDRTAGLVAAARRRLLLWDISAAQIEQIERTRQARRTLTLHAPFGGFVTEKMVQAGQAVEMGMPLYRLADLSSVWVEADVYEQDLRFVRLGDAVQVEIAAYPGERFPGRVSYVYPDVRAETRTARVRVELSNPGGRIKPGMYATVQIDVPVTERALFVPRDAVMHSGSHTMVFVEQAAGTYRAREVQIGADLDGRTQILAGLTAGERVVKRANFLLDSESRLRENMGAMPGMNH